VAILENPAGLRIRETNTSPLPLPITVKKLRFNSLTRSPGGTGVRKYTFLTPRAAVLQANVNGGPKRPFSRTNKSALL
jgi:hypothetical protein